jgi:hypothetical protein
MQKDVSRLLDKIKSTNTFTSSQLFASLRIVFEQVPALEKSTIFTVLKSVTKG